MDERAERVLGCVLAERAERVFGLVSAERAERVLSYMENAKQAMEGISCTELQSISAILSCCKYFLRGFKLYGRARRARVRVCGKTKQV